MKSELEKGKHAFGSGQPKFQIAYPSQMVTSLPVVLEKRQVQLVIRGLFDSVVEFENGELAVCDFKTATVKNEYHDKYGRQLHGYAYALQHPAGTSLAIPDVKRLGLGVFEPAAFKLDPQAGAALLGGTSWIEIPYNDASFMAFLDEVAAVLERSEPPPPDLGCAFCRYNVLNAKKAAA